MGKAVFVLHGVYFFLKNPTLWRAAICPLLTTVIFSIIITAIFFAKVFGAQIALFSGYVATWLAVIMSLFLTLVEILLCIYVFASVILQYYRTRLENRVYELNDVQLEDKSSCVGDAAAGVQMTALSLLFLLITLPLNALPLLGSALFICINGMTFGWGLHSSYFSMKGLGFSQQLQFVRKHWKDYMAFGASALILSMIPLLNLLTVWTNIVGSALWVVEMEKNSTLEAYLTPGAEMENMKSPPETAAATNSTAETPQRLFSSNQNQNESETYENLE